MRDKTLQAETAEGDDSEMVNDAAGADAAEAGAVAEEEPSVDDPTAEGYDEAVEERGPFIAEPEILAQYSADPVALTEAEPFTEDELILQGAGRDLRPDTVVPSPEITSTEEAALEHLSELDSEVLADQFAMSE